MLNVMHVMYLMSGLCKSKDNTTWIRKTQIEKKICQSLFEGISLQRKLENFNFYVLTAFHIHEVPHNDEK